MNSAYTLPLWRILLFSVVNSLISGPFLESLHKPIFFIPFYDKFSGVRCSQCSLPIGRDDLCEPLYELLEDIKVTLTAWISCMTMISARR